MMATVKRKRKRSEIIEDEHYQRIDSSSSPWLPRLLKALLVTPFVWSWRQFTRLIGGIWNTTKAALGWTLRSSWRLLAWSFRVSKDATVWTVKLPFRAVAWTWQLVFGPPVRYSNPRYAEVHALIARRYRRRSRFITHLFIFALTNTAFWIDWLYKQNLYGPGYRLSSGLVVFTLFWAVVLAFHYVRMRHGVEEDQAIEQAIEREREWQAMQRRTVADDGRYARLAADGDEVELHAFHDSVQGKRKNR